jgi:hypothetical protein
MIFFGIVLPTSTASDMAFPHTEVARVICKSLSHEELKWTRSAKGHDLTGVTITKSEVMQDMKKKQGSR